MHAEGGYFRVRMGPIDAEGGYFRVRMGPIGAEKAKLKSFLSSFPRRLPGSPC